MQRGHATDRSRQEILNTASKALKQESGRSYFDSISKKPNSTEQTILPPDARTPISPNTSKKRRSSSIKFVV